MRRFINIVEGKAVRTTDENGNPFVIIENPNNEQRAFVLSRAPHDEVKGIVSPDLSTCYIWPAYHAHHAEAHGLLHGMDHAEMLPDPDEDMVMHPEFKNWCRFMLTIDGKGITDDMNSLTHEVAGCRAIQRMFGFNSYYAYINGEKITFDPHQ